MAVTATVSGNPNAPTIDRDDVRRFMRDYANNNILLNDVQFTPEEIDKAIEFAVDEWNVCVPISYDDASVIPKSILMLGTASWLMTSESFLQLRNQATYQDGDVVNIGVDDKHQYYLNFSLKLKEQWKETVARYKQQRNVESGYGSVSSGYRNVGRFHAN
jgi:hypothetical protein